MPPPGAVDGVSHPSENGGEKPKEENMAVWLTAKEKLEIRPFKLPELGSKDAKIRMKAVGICGSDTAYVKTMCCGDYAVTEPMVMGHEAAGIVEEVGSEVEHLSVGDRVALEPGISCGTCSQCKTGFYNLCPNMKFFATPPVNGCLADQIIHPADLCFKLPDSLTLEEGAMCEPLSVGVHPCRRTLVGPDTNVLIIGGGPIGLISVLCARAFGAPRIVMADVGVQKLGLAKKLGVDATILVSRDEKGGRHLRGIQIQKHLPVVYQSTVFRKVDVRPLITNCYGFSLDEAIEAFHKTAKDKTAVKVMFKL